MEWALCSGRGSLLSWVVVHHAVDPGWRDRTPYVIALVALAEEPQTWLYGTYIGAHSRLRDGLALEAVFVDPDPVDPDVIDTDERTLVHWQEAQDG
jgi:uncharacterized OB-fold protein